MCKTRAQAEAHVLGLLLAGHTPEEAETMLEDWPVQEKLTPLTDPDNLVLEEVQYETRPG